MVNQYGTYVKGNLFRGNYKAPGGMMHQPRTGYDKASNIGYDAAYYGMLGYGLYQERAALGAAGRAIGRGGHVSGQSDHGGCRSCCAGASRGGHDSCDVTYLMII